VKTRRRRTEQFGSMRFKACRRSEQDMEYPVMLTRKRGWNCEIISDAISKALALSARAAIPISAAGV